MDGGENRESPDGSAQSKNPRALGNFMHGNRETSGASAPLAATDRREKAECRTARMHAPEESDRGVVPMNRSNNEAQAEAESEEGRPRIKENVSPTYTLPTQCGERVSQGLAGVRQAAKERKKERFTALLHHLTEDLLRQSFHGLKREAATGVDGVTWKEYETGLAERLQDLHSRVHRGAYRAQPSRRMYIPKDDGRQRPIGIAALEDKIVQGAVVRILNRIYEEDFLGFSYGFRPGRSQHDALDALTVGIERRKAAWVLDADIRGFFDNLDHEWLLKFLQHRVADPRLLRLIRKWLKAGVSEEGNWSETNVGTPQGAVVSPLLANVYLHYALDQWVEAWRHKVARGKVIIVRYADDFVMGFQDRAEAERFLTELRERLRKFGLELHPDKTRLIEFGRYAEHNRKRRGESKPETFDFLGLTHRCGRTRKGYFHVQRETAGKRMRSKLKAIKQQLRIRMHAPVGETGKWLRSVVQGYFNYHAIPGNGRRLRAFRDGVRRLWWHALRRRGQRQPWTWERLAALANRWLPSPRILHPYPNVRFDAKHPR
jgi:group II intron reverse transcriptase/maturase